MARPEIDIRPLLVGFALIAALCAFPAMVQGGGVNGLADVSYFQDIADLPLAPGLTEEADRGLTFDKPDGRIIEAVAVGDVNPDAVIRFYRETLPALGWQAIGPKEGGLRTLRFAREGEQLTLTVVTRYREPEDQKQATELRIEISPE